MAEPIPIAVFARAPVAGAAKTRLIPRLGAEGAARLHAALVRHALVTALAARLGPVTLWGAPDASDGFFRDCEAAFGIALASQTEGDLGARMLAAFERHCPLLLIGSDCPALEPDHLRAAADALRAGADAVLLPAEDGGYVLIGLKRPVPELFAAMPWGSGEVMARTRRRLTRLGLRWCEPATLWDIDRPEDLDRLDACRRHALGLEASRAVQLLSQPPRPGPTR